MSAEIVPTKGWKLWMPGRTLVFVRGPQVPVPNSFQRRMLKLFFDISVEIDE